MTFFFALGQSGDEAVRQDGGGGTSVRRSQSAVSEQSDPTVRVPGERRRRRRTTTLAFLLTGIFSSRERCKANVAKSGFYAFVTDKSGYT